MAEPFRPVRLVDVELGAPPPPLDALDGYGSVRALVRLHGVPLGWVTVPVREGRVPPRVLEDAIASRLAAPALDHLLHDHLRGRGAWRGAIGELLSRPCPPPGGSTAPMTVAVCTRGRPALLARCLDALERLDYPALDLLVVDNAPTDAATEDVVRARPGVRYACEPQRGLDRARNRAIVEARGELLAYTDDDAVPDPGWPRALAAAFAGPDVMAVTGPVVPLVLDTEAQELFERAGGFGMGFAPRVYRARGRVAIECFGEAGQLGTGANMAFRRSVFDAVGRFDPALDVGTPTNGGGDIEMLFRVVHAGWALAYTPAALVRHEHRRDRESLRQQLRNNGIGFSAYVVRSILAHPGERLAFARVWLRWLLRWPAARLARSLVRQGPVPRDLLAAELVGAFAGLLRYQRARRIAAQAPA